MRFQAVVSLFVLLSCGGGASADCPEARDHYLAVVEEIREYLGRYVQCIELPRTGGLQFEFRRLSDAQSEFEKAVEECPWAKLWLAATVGPSPAPICFRRPRKG